MTTVKLYTKDVIKACDAYSISLTEKLDAEFEREVQSLVKEPKSLFGFRFGGCTRAQAEQRVRDCQEHRFMLHSYQHWHSRVNDIRRACESSSVSMIDIDVDDLKMIMPFLKYDEIQKR